jgi:IPT/TIG domain
MKWLLRSVPLFALVLVACTTTNNPVTNIYTVDSTKPTITRFSPDTVWTLGTLTIYGNHFGYYPLDLRVIIDTAQVQQFTYGDDTMLTAIVPEGSQAGLIHITTINGTTTSAKPVVVEYTFNPHTINDTLPIGASFSIPGTGMNHYHGILRLSVAGVLYPIDSVFPDRIVSHVVAEGFSGSVVMSDSDGTYSGLGSLTVTRPSDWNTLSIIYDHLNVTETHHRTGYVNGPSTPIDSTWQTTVLYLGQHDVNVTGVPFARISGGLEYAIGVPYGTSGPDIQLSWDTISPAATVDFEQYSYFNRSTLTLDTEWSPTYYNGSASLPVTNAIEFMMQEFGYSITEDSTDTQGLVNWHETTTTTLNSGSFDLILKP